MATETKIDKTKICALDLDNELVEYLQKRFDVYDGSLGEKVRINKAYGHYTYCNLLLNYNIPLNIQEYEVFIEDMLRDSERDYNKDEHTRTENSREDAYYIRCNLPQTIFNPVPFGSYLLSQKLRYNRIRPCIKIVFLSASDYVNYRCVNENDYNDSKSYSYSSTSHYPKIELKECFGTAVKLCDQTISKDIFESFLNDIDYQVVAIPPLTFFNGKNDVDEHFCPLLLTKAGAVVSFAWLSEEDITIALPQTSRKKDLLDKTLNELVFRSFSEYFPEVEESAWLKNAIYQLPHHANLMRQREEICKHYEEALNAIDSKIELNNNKLNFLHKILTATGSELVQSMMTYLRWIGFENVEDMDPQHAEDAPLEEDIQIDSNEKGLLVVEVKGIGGTSTDAQCSQIHKIVFRRCEQRGAFDVHGLYIVNNELHKEPVKRTVPPFTSDQQKDAVRDKRGLIYTWQLFNLYYEIEDGIISKEEARERFYNSGLIDFSPTVFEVGKPYKYYQQHTVVCINVGENAISVGDNLYYKYEERWKKVTVLSIEHDSQSVNTASNGRFGLGLDRRIPENVTLFIKRE